MENKQRLYDHPMKSCMGPEGFQLDGDGLFHTVPSLDTSGAEPTTGWGTVEWE